MRFQMTPVLAVQMAAAQEVELFLVAAAEAIQVLLGVFRYMAAVAVGAGETYQAQQRAVFLRLAGRGVLEVT